MCCETNQSSQVIESEPIVRKRRASKVKILISTKCSQIIRLPIEESYYERIIKDPKLFRQWIEGLEAKYKSLMGVDISKGYQFHDIRYSSKMEIPYRRIRVDGVILAIQPSYVLPYFSGKVSECQQGILLYLRGSSLDSIVHCYGGNQQQWLDRVNHLGRFSIVGTSVKSEAVLSYSLTADEKITFLNGKEVYACITVGGDCILGADISLTEDQQGLGEAYGVFKTEVQAEFSDYTPKSVNTDGWPATRKAWKGLFEPITLILCFLHSYIKIRNISKKEPLKKELYHQIWQAYESENKVEFIRKINQLQQWANQHIASQTLLAQIEKMNNNAELYATCFDCEGKRTSNMVDRAIKPIDKALCNAQYFHGSLASAQLTMRALALGYNFLPFCQRTKLSKKNNMPVVEPMI